MSAPERAKTSVGWVIFWVVVAVGCVAGLGNSNSSGGSTTKTGPGSPSCVEQGKQEFTSFSDPAWKRYARECAPK